MFVDEAEIAVKAGHGGAGSVSFFAMKKGPSGGNGGRGGDVYAVLNNNVPDLRKYAENKNYKAEDGTPGASNRRLGKDGNDLLLHMPIGTTITDPKTLEEVELNEYNQKVLLAHGGRGGLGNDAFKSATNRTPRKAEPGQPGEERSFKLILKLIANYGFVGLPNAGKSSLLNKLTAANVKTASYPFTTLEPALGVFNGKVIADIPGLIEGASSGRGLGIKFLKHIEKVHLLLHCISVESQNVEKDYQTVLSELAKYKSSLIEKKSVILLTKTDLVDKDEVNKKIKKLKKFNTDVLSISIYDEDSVGKLKKIIG